MTVGSETGFPHVTIKAVDAQLGLSFADFHVTATLKLASRQAIVGTFLSNTLYL